MDISNRTLGLLLIAAIVISIGGTFISLNRLDGISTTGFATNNETGTVYLNISSELSIIVDDSTIDFGTCTLDSGRGYSEFDSSTDTAVNNSDCSGAATFPGGEDYIQVRNNGNVDVNVTLRTNITGQNLFTVGGSPSSTSYLQYKAKSASGGCTTANLQTTFVTLSTATAGDNYLLCDNLDYVTSNNTMEVYAFAHVNASVDSGGYAEWMFEARTA